MVAPIHQNGGTIHQNSEIGEALEDAHVPPGAWNGTMLSLPLARSPDRIAVAIGRTSSLGAAGAQSALSTSAVVARTTMGRC